MDDQSSQNGVGGGGGSMVDQQQQQMNSLVQSGGGGGGDDNQSVNSGGGPGGAMSNMQQPYSIPGILHFIQHEWVRFEHERSQWDVDRAELQARISILLGERKSQESLKCDLIRRIKMLEYALKQERAKFHRLKYGCDPPNMTADDMKPPQGCGEAGGAVVDPLLVVEKGEGGGGVDGQAPFTSVSNMTWRQGRQLLQQYLVEIGYTDNILDVRSNRVRSLLGLNNNNNMNNNNNNMDEEDILNGMDSTNNKKNAAERGGGGGGKGAAPNSTTSTAKKLGANNSSNALKMTEDMILDSEAAVMANFEFLSQTDVEMSDDDDANENDMDHDQLQQQQDHLNATTVEQQDLAKRKQNKIIIPDDDVDAEAEEVLNELNMLTGGGNAAGTDHQGGDSGPGLVLGELAQLTVNNEAENNYDTGSGNAKDGNFRKLWCAKFTLRSHFDSVRALAFHPQDPVLITASDDHTLKFWNIHKTVQAKKSPSLDVEPLYTFRAHTGPVLCVAMSGTGEFCYSGGVDGAIHCWKLPNSYIDPYDSYDPTVLKSTLEGHTDAVWGLTVNHAKSYLASFSADNTVRLWSPAQQKAPMLRSFQAVAADGGAAITGPTSVDFVRDELDRVVVAYRGAQLVTFDTETGKQVLRFDTAKQQDQAAAADRFIYKVVSHPTMPVTITAHHDRHIRFWDTNSGQLVHSMVAHLDAVTSLAVDPKGLYLLSGSHDNSIRLWNLDNKTCIQEITAHRKKFDESILDVAFHPTRGYIASGGADSLAKVFV